MLYPRLTNFNRTNSSDYLPLWQMPVAYNQPLSILITPILVEYHDEQRDLTFSGAKCEIDSLESKIGKLITVTLEVIPDSHEFTPDATVAEDQPMVNIFVEIVKLRDRNSFVSG